MNSVMTDLKETQQRIRRKVRREGDHIILDGHYEIPLQQCRTHKQILAWVEHLLPKMWIDKEHVEYFIYQARKANRLEVGL